MCARLRPGGRKLSAAAAGAVEAGECTYRGPGCAGSRIVLEVHGAPPTRVRGVPRKTLQQKRRGLQIVLAFPLSLAFCDVLVKAEDGGGEEPA